LERTRLMGTEPRASPTVRALRPGRRQVGQRLAVG
jgi:hypothetical protein